MSSIIKCPNCGKSYYRKEYTVCTAVYYPPIYKDGVNINPDKNSETVYCDCLNCNYTFSYENNPNREDFEKTTLGSKKPENIIIEMDLSKAKPEDFIFISKEKSICEASASN